jgi:antitoxin component YwqK of YwqJK toxin-antitoxin module
MRDKLQSLKAFVKYFIKILKSWIRVWLLANSARVPFLLSLSDKICSMIFRKGSALVIFLLLFSFITTAQTDTVFNQTDAHNLKQGWWKKSYPGGKPMYKGFFRDNKPVGEMLRYYENGAIKASMVYDKNGEYARARLFYADGQVAATGVYYNSLKDSIWCYYSYYDHSLTTRETYTRGKRNGTMINYYNNGSPSEKITWVNDRKEGPWEQYFANNTLKLKTTYKGGQLEGEFIVNFESGKPYLKGGYKNGLREGKWIFFKEDGSTDMELTYQAGVTPDTEKLDARQQDLFRMIEENKGKFEEPDETNFLTPAGR